MIAVSRELLKLLSYPEVLDFLPASTLKMSK